MDSRVKDWANEVLAFYENEGVEISGTEVAGVFKFISKLNEPIPFLLKLSEYGLTVSFQAHYSNISFKEINTINSKLTITKIYAPHNDDDINLETTIPVLMEADDALMLLIQIFIEESKAAMDLLEEFSNQTE